MAMTDFTIIRRSLTARLFSTTTTVLTVAVAVALMLVLLSMRDSGRRAFERGSGNTHLVVSRDASPLVAILNAVFYAGAPARAIEWDKYRQIADAFPFQFAVPIQQGDSYRGHPVMATTTDFFQRFSPDPQRGWRLRDGRYFENPFEVVVGADAARNTNIRIGDAIFLTHGIERPRAFAPDDEPSPHVHTDFEFRVVGILEPTGSAHDRALFTDLESSWIIHAHDRRLREDPSITTTTGADLLDADRLITGIYLRVATRPGRDATAVLQQVFDQLRRDPTITVASPRQQITTLFAIVSNIDQVLIAMAAAVMVSSGIAIMLALYNSMDQRRRQIAVLRVLGCSRKRIFSLVLTESALIGAIGAAAGLALSVLGAHAVSGVMHRRVGLVIEPAYDPAWVLPVLVGTILLAAAAGLIPALTAYHTPVARNLKPAA